MKHFLAHFLIILGLFATGALGEISNEDMRLYAKYNSPPDYPLNLDKLRDLAKEMPDWAPPVFLWHCNGGHPKERMYLVGDLVAGLPQVEDYVRRKLAETPQLLENGKERYELIGPLRGIRCRWSLELLGELLEQPDEMKTNYTPEEVNLLEQAGSFGSGPNNRFAAGAVLRMRLNHVPSGLAPDGLVHNAVAILRDWWRENKHQPDSFFFDGIDLTSRPPWERPIPPQPSQEEILAMITQGLPPKTTPAKPPEEPAPPKPPAHQSNWPWWLAGALIYIVSVLTFKRYKPKPSKGDRPQ